MSSGGLLEVAGSDTDWPLFGFTPTSDIRTRDFSRGADFSDQTFHSSRGSVEVEEEEDESGKHLINNFSRAIRHHLGSTHHPHRHCLHHCHHRYHNPDNRKLRRLCQSSLEKDREDCINLCSSSEGRYVTIILDRSSSIITLVIIITLSTRYQDICRGLPASPTTSTILNAATTIMAEISTSIQQVLRKTKSKWLKIKGLTTFHRAGSAGGVHGTAPTIRGGKK